MSSSASVIMTGFSGWGPTDDGLIKPDIVANGIDLWSSVSFDVFGTFLHFIFPLAGITGWNSHGPWMTRVISGSKM